MNTDQPITYLLTVLKTDIINSLQAKGITGPQTIDQIQITADDKQQQLSVPGYLLIQETGRGPTSKNAPPGNPPMIQRILQWCQQKGIPAKAAWAIKKKIDKVGYPGKPGLLSAPLSDANINRHLDCSSEIIAENITTQILNNISL